MNAAKAMIATEQFRGELISKIEKDGVYLKEFNKAQQERIIVMYAAALLKEKGM